MRTRARCTRMMAEATRGRSYTFMRADPHAHTDSRTQGAPLSRTSSASSARSLDEIERLDVGEEINRIASPVMSFVSDTVRGVVCASARRDWQ